MDKKDINKISCSKEKNGCQTGSWINSIFPQLWEKFQMFGEKIKEVVVTQGQVNNKKVWSQGSWLISMIKFSGMKLVAQK